MDTPIVVKPSHQPLQSDGLALERISRITGVRLGRNVRGGNAGLQSIAEGDMAEVVFARRLLHRY